MPKGSYNFTNAGITAHNKSCSTRRKSMRHFNTDTLKPFTIGFDGIFDRLLDDTARTRTSGFPPYNIRKNSETEFKIDLAVAGLDMNDVDIEVENGILTIKSTFDETNRDQGEILHRGISFKKFTRTFTLADDIEVAGADLKNGMLTINLKRIIPDAKKPKKIAINSIPSGPVKREYLTE